MKQNADTAEEAIVLSIGQVLLKFGIIGFAALGSVAIFVFEVLFKVCFKKGNKSSSSGDGLRLGWSA